MKRILCTIALILALVCVVASCNKSPEITISEDGYWVINGEKTDVKAQVEKDDKGDNGNGATATNENPLGLAFFLKDDGTYIVEIGNAKYLSKIEIPATYNGKAVTEVRNFASKALKEITISDGVTSIGDLAFSNCSSLTSITIPDSVTSIGDDAFYGCNSALYTEYELGKYVGDETNPYAVLIEVTNKNMSTYAIHPDTKVIAYEAFRDCSHLTSITIPDGVRGIGDRAFYGCTSLTSVTIPDSVTNIGESAFSGCTSLRSATIGDSVTSIGSGAFGYCSSLKSVTIPDSVTSIGDSAFGYCDSLKSVTIGNSVKSIGERAFYSCDSLTSVTIGDSVTSIGSGAFAWCDSLTSILVDNDNTAYQSIDGNLYSKGGKTLIAYAIGKTDKSFTIPDSVTSICDWAFYECRSLTSVTFANPNGWWYAYSADATSGANISAESLADPATAAGYLKSTYRDYYWFRTE